ncbi:hypothetical protein INR49_017110 [Caranx melampygus]|nr:hypothetical protein INR49_017110 [Caranx melampygus]
MKYIILTELKSDNQRLKDENGALIRGCEGGIHLLLWLQWMPLGDGTTGVGQHVGPVFQPGPCGLASHPDLPNGIVLANLVIIQHCDHSLDFLGGTGEKHHNKVQIIIPLSILQQNTDGEFSSSGDVTQGDANVTQLLWLEDKDLDIGIRGATAVHGEEISCLQDSHVVINGVLELPKLFFLLHFLLFLIPSQSRLNIVFLIIVILLFLQRQKGGRRQEKEPSQTN